MPDAVIVAATRSPIGRAIKGSLRDVRPDALAAAMVRAVVDKVPELGDVPIDDLMLGCSSPGGLLCVQPADHADGAPCHSGG
jgi:acetyl-CoA C-acetyltransferase